MGHLPVEYDVRVDDVDRETWHQLIADFDDAAFYQTWDWGAARFGAKNLSHLRLYRNSNLVGMVQVGILSVTRLPLGIAYVSSGPMWRRAGCADDLSNFHAILAALHEEYVVKRSYFLRILPQIVEDGSGEMYRSTYADQGFSCTQNPERTVLLNLSPSLEQLRRQVGRNWRRNLTDACKHRDQGDFEVVEGDSDELCAQAMQLLSEMRARKGYFQTGQDTALAVHKSLPKELKLRLALCLRQGEPLSAMGWWTLGKTGTHFVAATGEIGLKFKTSFLLWWRMVEHMKERNLATCDLMGISRERNPGGYHFKTGLAGSSFHEDDSYIGDFSACNSKLSASLICGLLRTRNVCHNVAHRFSEVIRGMRSQHSRG